MFFALTSPGGRLRHQRQTSLLERCVDVGVLHQEPRRPGRFFADERSAGSPMTLDDGPQLFAVLGVLPKLLRSLGQPRAFSRLYVY
jgi:hypothetical protein